MSLKHKTKTKQKGHGDLYPNQPHPGIPLTRDPMHNSVPKPGEGVDGDNVFTLKWAPS